jgi:hypothetical protein
VWHPGYWGRYVGYYGGVNYGFGYMGIGFVGGMWRGGVFDYNTAVMRVGPGIRNTYMNRAIVDRYTVARGSHVSYSGGRGGINHPPNAEERAAEREQHMGRTSFQMQHENTAMRDRSSYFNANHGRPGTPAVSRSYAGSYAQRESSRGNFRPQQQYRQQPQSRPQQQYRSQQQYRQQPQSRQESRPQERSRPQARSQGRAAPKGQSNDRKR